MDPYQQDRDARACTSGAATWWSGAVGSAFAPHHCLRLAQPGHGRWSGAVGSALAVLLPQRVVPGCCWVADHERVPLRGGAAPLGARRGPRPVPGSAPGE